ncbi:hypothetical protein NDU88_001374 [Pleurodeles waltl]|uniref:Uncharacterized protein n=1 Tax=Pleurodeles waltl TaxID=8319 RepID=A0AAV7Q8F6_PLEWA|nr:hypothetical protein NDU88_001374 [Pleurodeles waltl]
MSSPVDPSSWTAMWLMTPQEEGTVDIRAPVRSGCTGRGLSRAPPRRTSALPASAEEMRPILSGGEEEARPVEGMSRRFRLHSACAVPNSFRSVTSSRPPSH